jgi:hypothetical protein
MQNIDHDQLINKTGTPLEPNVSESSIVIKKQVHEADNSDDNVSSATIFSSQKSNMDYVTLQGIENRTALTKRICMVLS